MKEAPLILISTELARPVPTGQSPSLCLSDNYPHAIVAGGGIPWVMPRICDPNLVRECVRRCDGVLLTGGDDVQTELYNMRVPEELKRKLGPTDPERDLLETLVIAEVFEQRKPLLAVCRGHQMVNVALGGTLIVDLPSQRPDAIRHDRFDRRYEIIHDVALTDGSLAAKIFATQRLGVNSSHHQAVDRVAKTLRATSRSADGIVESLELAPEDAEMLPFFLTVQFHPERLVDRYPEHLVLFKQFIQSSLSVRHKHI